MRVGVVIFPGSNCDHDALWTAGHVSNNESFTIWHKSGDLNGAQVIIIPGGFSYGDYLRCGAIAKFSPVMDKVIAFANNGGPVIGICNGFQILTETGLLPGALLRNNTLKFESRWVALNCETSRTPFTKHIHVGAKLRVPIAHGEGKYYIDSKGLDKLFENDQIVFRYSGANPNGSVADIAGICNLEGNVVGMMPHPERAGEELTGSSDGLKLFRFQGGS